MMFKSSTPKERDHVGTEIPGRANREASGAVVEAMLGASTYMDGHLRVQGGLRVDGRITGQLTVEGHCEVGPDGYIEATLNATDLTVAGRIAGDVQVKERLHVVSTGVITGDVRTKVLVVEEGGSIEGKWAMGVEVPEPPAGNGGEKGQKGLGVDSTSTNGQRAAERPAKLKAPADGAGVEPHPQ